MTNEDHLDKETSLSVQVTENGVSGKAKSRAIAAADRLVGNLSEWINVRLEDGNAQRRAKIEGEVALIKAAADYGIKQIGEDPEFANRMLENQFRKMSEAQLNKDAVFSEALEDLKQNPPSDDEANAGPEEIDPTFMHRFETYAEGASTEELQQRWGRVLATEVRSPGGFSVKVLRVVDELSSETALLFERLCESRIANVLPKYLVGELSLSERSALVTAGLMLEPGLGQISQFREITDNAGAELFFWGINHIGLAIEKPIDINAFKKISPGTDGTHGINVYILTDAGVAISSILPNSEDAAMRRLIGELKTEIPIASLREYRRDKSASDWNRTMRWGGGT